MNASEEAIRSYYEYVDNQAYEDLFSLFAEDITYHRPGQEPIDGMKEFQTFYHEIRPIERGSHTVSDLVIDEETIAVRGQFSGVMEGQQVAFGFSDFHRFNDDGLIEARWSYTDTGRV